MNVGTLPVSRVAFQGPMVAEELAEEVLGVDGKC